MFPAASSEQRARLGETCGTRFVVRKARRQLRVDCGGFRVLPEALEGVRAHPKERRGVARRNAKRDIEQLEGERIGVLVERIPRRECRDVRGLGVAPGADVVPHEARGSDIPLRDECVAEAAVREGERLVREATPRRRAHEIVKEVDMVPTPALHREADQPSLLERHERVVDNAHLRAEARGEGSASNGSGFVPA